MSHRLITASAAAALAATVAACGGNSPTRVSTTRTNRTASHKPSQTVTKVTGRRVSVTMSDFKFSPSTLTARPGKLKITAKNKGRQQHEFVLLRTTRAPDAIP